MMPEFASAGLTELVLVGSPPADPAAATAWAAELAHRWELAGQSGSGAA